MLFAKAMCAREVLMLRVGAAASSPMSNRYPARTETDGTDGSSFALGVAEERGREVAGDEDDMQTSLLSEMADDSNIIDGEVIIESPKTVGTGATAADMGSADTSFDEVFDASSSTLDSTSACGGDALEKGRGAAALSLVT